jgi:hypothetical protein
MGAPKKTLGAWKGPHGGQGKDPKGALRKLKKRPQRRPKGAQKRASKGPQGAEKGEKKKGGRKTERMEAPKKVVLFFFFALFLLFLFFLLFPFLYGTCGHFLEPFWAP